MPYDFSDPNFDFAGQEDIVLRALKEGIAQQATPFNKGVNTGQAFAMSGADPGAFLSRAAGMLNQRNAEGKMGELNKAQQLKFAEMLRELGTPGTVAKEQLVQGQGPLLEPPTETVQIPMGPLDESRRRMGVYGRMSGLPMAAKMAQQGMVSEMDMPEKMALRDQQIAAAKQQQAERLAAQQQLQADRLADQRERDKDRFAQQESMARLAASLRPERGDKGPSAAEIKRQDAIEAKGEARLSAGAMLDQMDKNLAELEASGGIPSNKKGALPNAISSLRNSMPGQILGSTFATKDQANRNDNESIATGLLMEMKNLKGLSASQMNSNMELQRYLTAIKGGANYDAETMKNITSRARDLLGVSKAAPAPAAPAAAPGDELSPAEQAELDKLRAKHGRK